MIDSAPPPVFEPIDARDVQEPITPKRGKRTLSQTPAAIAARERRAAMKGKPRADSRPRRKSAPRPRGPKSLAPEIGAFLALVNGIVVVSPLGTRPVEAITDPNVAPERIGDELDAAEIAALASALDAQCRRSPRFRRYVEMVLGGASGGTLITVLGLIAARRAARHGILPANVDAMAGMILAADVAALADHTSTPERETRDPDTGERAPDRDAGDDDGVSDAGD